MSQSMNLILLVGRLGHEPEMHTGPYTEFARFRLAHTTQFNGQKTVQWHNICAFGKQAEICHKHLHKGDLCCIEGRLDSHTYEKNGQKHYTQSIVAEKVTFLTPKRRPDVRTTPVQTNETFDECVPF